MTSIIDTIKADWTKVEAFVASAGEQLGAEVRAILSSVGGSALVQAVALAKETHVGTAILNSVSAVEASGGNIAAALPTIIANTSAAIVVLDKSGSLLAGLEADVETFATALVNDIVSDFKGNAVAGPLITLFGAHI